MVHVNITQQIRPCILVLKVNDQKQLCHMTYALCILSDNIRRGCLGKQKVVYISYDMYLSMVKMVVS